MAQAKHAVTPSRKKKRLISAVTVLVILAALFVFLYRDELFSKTATNAHNIASGEPFTYENGSDQSFALMGDWLAISSSTGLQLLDENGETFSRQVFSMGEPCVSAGGGTCVFYDVGGTALRAFFDENYVEMDSENNIIAVNVNSQGWFAVTTEEAGYKGSVVVYDNNGDPAYKWYSGTGYVLDAVVTPDCSRMVALTVEGSGSSIHFFRLTDEEEYATASLPAELCFDMACSDSGSIYVLSDSTLHFFDKNGSEDKAFSFEDNYLVDYEFSENFCALVLSKYISGSEVTITSFSSGGRQLGSADLSYSPACLSSQGSKLLVFGTYGLCLFDKDMDVVKESSPVYGYKSALLMSDGQILLLAAYHGEKVTIK